MAVEYHSLLQDFKTNLIDIFKVTLSLFDLKNTINRGNIMTLKSYNCGNFYY